MVIGIIQFGQETEFNCYLYLLTLPYLGGSDSEYSGQIFEFDENAILVTGYSESPDYPTVGADAGSYHAKWDVVYSVLSKSLETLYYSAYFGGNGDDAPNGMFLSPDNIFIGGYTSSQDLPITPTAIQSRLSGESDGFIAIMDRSHIVTGILANPAHAKTLIIDQNYPNPVTDGWTSIGYSLPPGSSATLTVYDRSGRAMKFVSLTDDIGPGSEYRLDVSSFASGVYFYELRDGSTSIVRKMLVQRACY